MPSQDPEFEDENDLKRISSRRIPNSILTCVERAATVDNSALGSEFLLVTNPKIYEYICNLQQVTCNMRFQTTHHLRFPYKSEHFLLTVYCINRFVSSSTKLL